jgi:L-cysteate sulfo-lyase
MPATSAAALAALASLPVAPFGDQPTPLHALPRLARAAGVPHTLLAKRDDVLPFGFGGNKVRKLRCVIPQVLAGGADTVITTGGVQSNHARATAAAAAASGLACHIVANGEPPAVPTGNALLNRLLGATVEYVPGRADRAAAMERAASRLRAAGRRPAVVPLGASTPVGALGVVLAVEELLRQGPAPDVIVHACSSGGTSAGLAAGLALHGLPTRLVGISADDPPAEVLAAVAGILDGVDALLGAGGTVRAALDRLEVDDGFVGPGYGEPTEASTEAQRLAATTEGMFVDHTYTAKALAGLLARCRDGRIAPGRTVLFWHTGGQVALFA